jgi:hypothetical protein
VEVVDKTGWQVGPVLALPVGQYHQPLSAPPTPPYMGGSEKRVTSENVDDLGTTHPRFSIAV